MEGIIDVHAHLLPGVDDGADNWEEAVWMLNCAYEQGIRAVIATPHYSRRQNTDRLRQKAQRLTEEAEKIGTDFKVYLGQEILYFESIIEQLQEGHALTLAGSRYVLVEFMPQTSYGKIYQGIRKIMLAGYHPVVAHVERYDALRDAGQMDELAGTGCMLQLNYRSLQGGLFDRNAKWCRKQVLDGRIGLLGTDAHHRDYRTPDIAGSLRWLESHAGSQLAAMTRNHALEIIRQGMAGEPLQKDKNQIRDRENGKSIRDRG